MPEELLANACTRSYARRRAVLSDLRLGASKLNAARRLFSCRNGWSSRGQS
jgi:hypothetical protein